MHVVDCTPNPRTVGLCWDPVGKEQIEKKEKRDHNYPREVPSNFSDMVPSMFTIRSV